MTDYVEQGPELSCVWLVPPELTIQCWRDIRELVLEAQEHGMGESDEWDLVDRLARGDIQMWLVMDKDEQQPIGVKLTRMQQYPRRKALVDFVTAGRGALGENGWFEDVQDEIEEWAREQGCEYIEGIGRPGWERIGKPMGYRKQYTVYVKEL